MENITKQFEKAIQLDHLTLEQLKDLEKLLEKIK
jgi:hypothetical protein